MPEKPPFSKMQRFGAFFIRWTNSYHNIDVWLSNMIEFYEGLEKAENPLSDEHITIISEAHFVKAKAWFDRFDVPATKRQFHTLETLLKRAKKPKPSEVRNEWRQLMKRFREEGDNIRFLYVDLADDYATPLDTWGTIPTTFDGCHKDIIGAMRGHALELPNASVFHSMRILEFGIRELAARVHVSMTRTLDPTWNSILQDIEAAIEAMRVAPYRAAKPTLAQRARRKKRLEYYANLARQFRYFKDVWRNHVMHGSAEYDDDTAARVIQNVRDFMCDLEIRPPR